MTDNYNEGHPGATIEQIADFAKPSLPSNPALILLMAGTNDMNLDLSTSEAPVRLASLVDMCISACPDAVLLLAQLTPCKTADVESRVEAFNREVVRLAEDRASQGKKIAAIDMPAFVSVADLKDGLHPNDIGYGKMAEAWYAGVQNAVARGWFNPATARVPSTPVVFTTQATSSTTLRASSTPETGTNCTASITSTTPTALASSTASGTLTTPMSSSNATLSTTPTPSHAPPAMGNAASHSPSVMCAAVPLLGWMAAWTLI